MFSLTIVRQRTWVRVYLGRPLGSCWVSRAEVDEGAGPERPAGWGEQERVGHGEAFVLKPTSPSSSSSREPEADLDRLHSQASLRLGLGGVGRRAVRAGDGRGQDWVASGGLAPRVMLVPRNWSLRVNFTWPLP